MLGVALVAQVAQQVDLLPTEDRSVIEGWTREPSPRLLFVDSRKAVLHLVLVDDPDAPDLLQLRQGDEFKFSNVCGAFVADVLLGFQHPAQPVLASILRIGPVDRPPLEELNCTVHPAVVPKVPVVADVEFVPEFEEGEHPLLLLIVLDHRGHRSVALDQRADPAAEAA